MIVIEYVEYGKIMTNRIAYNFLVHPSIGIC